MALFARHLYLPCLALLLAGSAHAASQSLPLQQSLSTVATAAHQAHLQQLQAQAREAVQMHMPERPRPAGRGAGPRP